MADPEQPNSPSDPEQANSPNSANNDLWEDIKDDISEASSEHPVFEDQDEHELKDLEKEVLAEWEAVEDHDATDPYKVLGSHGGEPLTRIEARLESKLQACGPGEEGLVGVLKSRLRRAGALLHDKAKFQKHAHIAYRDMMKEQDKWACVKYKNGYYEGCVLRPTPTSEYVREGQGITVIAGSEKYEGMYQNDQRHGMGIQFWKNGDVYVGSWEEDRMHGNGNYYYSTGAKYSGPFRQGARHGKGRMTFKNRALYIGEFTLDQRTGQGYLKQPGRKKHDPCTYYLGQWSRNLKDGQGHYFCEGEGDYKGQFAKDEFHGEGKLVFDNGDVYEGEFVRGFLDNHGTYDWADSGNKFTGSFWRGRRDGNGEAIFQETKQVYNGQWKQNKPTGKGMLQLQCGDEYDGEFRDGKMHGRGNYHWAHGSAFVGSFEHSCRHGEGKLTFPDGKTYEGQFWEDLRHGKGTFSSDGHPHEENWHYGSLVERGPDHVMATQPLVDDIRIWDTSLTDLGYEPAPELQIEIEKERKQTKEDEKEQSPKGKRSPKKGRK